MKPISDPQTFADLAWFHRFTLEPEATLDQTETDRIEAYRYGRDADLRTVIRRLDLVLEDPKAQAATTRGWVYEIAGLAWQDLPTGDRGSNIRKAIEYYKSALEVRTCEQHPVEWAMTQNYLGTAWRNLPTGNRGSNIRKAIDCCESALEVYTLQQHPVDWAMIQNNLGNAWRNLTMGDPGSNIRKAIGFYESALEVSTRERHPVEWAMTTANVGLLQAEASELGQDLGDPVTSWRAAIEGLEAAGAGPMAERIYGWITGWDDRQRGGEDGEAEGGASA